MFNDDKLKHDEFVTRLIGLREKMLNIYSKSFNKDSDIDITIKHSFEKQADPGVIYDAATSLYWQQSGSDKPMEFDAALEFIAQLNADRFGGYSDWRLPTLEEAMTLMAPKQSKDGMYIDPIFDNKQQKVWTADKTVILAVAAWFAGYFHGYCNVSAQVNYDIYVRAVRS